MNLSFDHVHLQSSDPEATIGFFQTMFDGQVEWTIQFDGTDITRMKVLDTHVNIFSRAPKVSDPDPDGRRRSPLRPSRRRLRRGDRRPSQARRELRRRAETGGAEHAPGIHQRP